MIDWKARLRNKYFVAAAVSFIVLTVKVFTGYQFPENTDSLINALLSALSGLGILIDASTPGIADVPKVTIPVSTQTSTSSEIAPEATVEDGE